MGEERSLKCEVPKCPYEAEYEYTSTVGDVAKVCGPHVQASVNVVHDHNLKNPGDLRAPKITDLKTGARVIVRHT